MPGPATLRQFLVDVGQNRPVPRRADLQENVRRVLDMDDLIVRDEGFGAVGRQILGGVARIDRLDEQILRIGVGAGDAPGDAVVLSEQHERRAGHGRALYGQSRRDDSREIPQDRRLNSEVRIVGEDRFAGLGARA